MIDIDEFLYQAVPESEELMLAAATSAASGSVTSHLSVLYMMELYADGVKPVVHVWRVGEE